MRFVRHAHVREGVPLVAIGFAVRLLAGAFDLVFHVRCQAHQGVVG